MFFVIEFEDFFAEIRWCYATNVFKCVLV